MKQDHSRIAIILDRSGSMGSVAAVTVSSFNEFINQQKSVPGTADLLLVRFDNEYEVVYDKPLADAPPLTHETYQPRGTTALHDAIGQTIDDLGKRLDASAEADRPSKVIVCIMTDGFENASRRYSRDRVAEMIKHQTEKYGWAFTFLGANQDAILTGEKLNIPMASSLTYAQTAAGTSGSVAAMSSSVADVRRGFTRHVSYNVGQRRAAMAQDEDKTPAGK